VALLGANIPRAILRDRSDRRIAGRARGFDVFDDRAYVKLQQLLVNADSLGSVLFSRLQINEPTPISPPVYV
jgi:hypothetical protein